MTFYYVLLFLTRFHSDPRAGMPLFNAAFVPVTPVKIAGCLTVFAVLVIPRPKDAVPRRRNVLGVVYFAFAAIQILEVAVFRLPMPADSLSALVSFGLFLIATRALVSTEERMRKTVRAMILASAFASLWLYKQHFLQHFARPDGIEGDSNYEALTLVTGIPLALWMVRYETDSWWKRIGAACAGFMVGGILLTESRAGLIAAVVMGLAAVVLARRKALTTALLGITVAAGVVLAPAGLVSRFHHITFEGSATNGDEASSRIHFELLKAGLAMIESYPLTGVGLERFKAVAPDYNSNLLKVAGRRFIAHNTYVQIAAETGLPVLLLFMVLITLALMNCRAVRHRGNEPLAQMATAMQLGLIGYSVAAASVTAEYVTTLWILIFLSQNLREIAAAFSAHDSQRPVEVASRAIGTIGRENRRAVDILRLQKVEGSAGGFDDIGGAGDQRRNMTSQ